MSIFGKEKYLEEQGLQNIEHFQVLVFVCHLESSVPKQFVHQCLSWSTKMNGATPQTCFFSERFLKKIIKLSYKTKRRYFPTRILAISTFHPLRTLPNGHVILVLVHSVFLLKTCCAIQIYELLIGALPRHLMKNIVSGSSFVQCHNKFDFNFFSELEQSDCDKLSGWVP
jgi:hypothetical protein